MDLNLKGRKVAISGASQGIGEGLARSFASEGCPLWLVARSGDKLEKLAAELKAAHGVDVKTLAIDMTAEGAIDKVAAFVGDADVLVNNAGSIPGGNLWDVDEKAWRAGWELKVFGYINLTRLVYAKMRERGGGVILNNIGSGGENFDFNYICGTTGNAALMAFTRALGGRSLLDHNIRVVGVNAGLVETPRIVKVLATRAKNELGDAGRANEMTKSLPLGRPATVPEVADLFVYLASDRSAYTSGVICTIDGGMTSKRSIS
ncbi:SDR family oxidoreductase [Ramlibacter sp.]|uniref:SDR family oxidoreductase n=1 Tax=Ramlibacter sp. TaxID=1917967 RepID=UPI003D1122AD